MSPQGHSRSGPAGVQRSMGTGSDPSGVDFFSKKGQLGGGALPN